MDKIEASLAIYAEVNWPEKVYVQTDKEYYTNGDTLWIKTYVVNGVTHIISSKSHVVYVELFDSEEKRIAERKVYVGTEGASGDIVIPDGIGSGTYVLRAFTKYMLNEEDPVFFEKSIYIRNQLPNPKIIQQETTENQKQYKLPGKEGTDENATRPSIEFFPEGGDLVSDLVCVLALKVTDCYGRGLALSGKIIDQNDNFVSAFNSHAFGLGKTHFMVERDKEYFGEITINGKIERYALPKALSTGYALQISNLGDHFRVQISTNKEEGLKGALLLGHLRGDLIIKQELTTEFENIISVKVITSKLRDGVAHFTLFAPNGEPVCERLVFIENPENTVQLSLDTDGLEYNYRESVAVDLAVSDTEGNPIGGDFSMSVVAKNRLDNNTSNIKNWLLLNSDLKGDIEKPDYFFEGHVKTRRFKLDLLMLTHGWRRFTWKKLKSLEIPKSITFQPEKGIMISGRTTAVDNRYRPK